MTSRVCEEDGECTSVRTAVEEGTTVQVASPAMPERPRSCAANERRGSVGSMHRKGRLAGHPVQTVPPTAHRRS